MKKVKIIDHSKPSDQPASPYCVYSISFKGHHKLYVGSTIQWPLRINSHLGRLRAGKHANKYLQRAYDKYGESKVIFGIIERPEVSLGHDFLLKREGFWIKALRSADRDYGYNLESIPSKGGVKGINCKTFVIYDRNDNRIVVDNLKEFCLERGLNYHKMHKAISGRSVEYNGWKGSLNRKPLRDKPFRLKSPDGQIYEGYGISQFCRAHGLPLAKIYRVLKGLTPHYESWTCPDAIVADNRAKTYTLKGPNSEILLVKNLSKWCRKQPIRISYEMLTQGRVSQGWKIIKRHD